MEAKQFVVGLESLKVESQKDFEKLNKMLVNTNDQIEWLDKFKDECGAPLLAFVTQVRRKMTYLEI